MLKLLRGPYNYNKGRLGSEWLRLATMELWPGLGSVLAHIFVFLHHSPNAIYTAPSIQLHIQLYIYYMYYSS